MDVVWIVEWLRATPDDSKAGVGGRGRGGVGELHVVTVDCVTEKLSVDARYATFNVELTHEPRLGDELLQNKQAVSNGGRSKMSYNSQTVYGCSLIFDLCIMYNVIHCFINVIIKADNTS